MDAPSWRLDSSSDGIRLYSSPVIGTAIIPFKAVMTIPGTIEEVSLVLEDTDRRGEWMSHFNMNVIDRANDYDETEYLYVDMPWPASDRSAVIRVRISVSDDMKSVTIAGESTEAEVADPMPDLVRAKVHASTFRMTQVGDGVEVAVLLFVDPCGRIPSWIVNFYTGQVARATLTALRRQVARKLYPPVALDGMRQRIQAYPILK